MPGLGFPPYHLCKAGKCHFTNFMNNCMVWINGHGKYMYSGLNMGDGLLYFK